MTETLGNLIAVLEKENMNDTIADAIAALRDRAIVAVDGVDGAGKTTFADRLTPMLEARGRSVVRASVDGFHNPRAVRYARGKQDPLGFFLDSYDYAAMRRYLTDPFRRSERRVRTACFDHTTDAPVNDTELVGEASVLLLDGIFLHRDELLDIWDYSIFLDVPFDVSYRRMAQRDGFDPDPKAAANRRYHSGQLIYLEKCRPRDRASVVLAG